MSGKEIGEVVVKVLSKVNVEVQQYDGTYGKILSGVKPGDVLKNLGVKSSGTLRINNTSGSSNRNQGGFSMGGMPMGGGMPGGR